MGRASGGSNTPHWIKNNILDFLRAMSVKIAVEWVQTDPYQYGDTDRPSAYTGPVGSVRVRIRYPYQFGIASKVYPFGSVPVEVQCKRLDPIQTGTDRIDHNNISRL